jgi:prepilin-type N-terminal cleavage/methylation domain-containing protein
MRRSERGFTLLEVLAAVAIIGIVFSTLMRAQSEGLRSEGSSKRRLEASLLADEVLAEVEEQISTGAEMELGVEQRDEDPFTVEIEITAFDLDAAIPLPTVDSEGGAVRPAVGLAAVDESPIRQVEVRVLWIEGFNEYAVSRTTFGIDPAAVQVALGNAAMQAGEQNGEAAP